jgi:hypothetical protein
MRGPQSGLILPHVPGGTNVNLQRLCEPRGSARGRVVSTRRGPTGGSLWHRPRGSAILLIRDEP